MGGKVSEERLNNKVECKVCKVVLKNYKALAKHLKYQHSLSSETYYRQYIMKPEEDVCNNPICSNKTRWITLSEGYAHTCSHVCHGVIHKGKNNSFYGKKHTKAAKKVIGRASSKRRHTQETKDKIRNTLKGRPHNWGVSGMTDKHHTLETKAIIKQKALASFKNGRVHPNKGKKMPPEYGERISKYRQAFFANGGHPPNYQGGISFEPYPPSFNQQLKDRIRVRDNFICQKCGVPELEYYRRLDIHHIDYNKENCNEDNLITLCQRCNILVNTNREHWTSYFKDYLLAKSKSI